MSIYLTSAPLGTFPPSSTKPTLFFSRASPPNNFRACAAGSPAPQAEKFSLPVHLWVKCKQNSESITLLTIFLTRVFGVFGVYHGISRRSSLVAPGSLLPRRQNAHKKYCAAHSVLFKFLRDHLWQLYYPGWLLHAKALQQSVSRFAENAFSTFTNTILKTKIL